MAVDLSITVAFKLSETSLTSDPSSAGGLAHAAYFVPPNGITHND